MLGDVRPADETVAAISDARGNTGGGVTSDTGGEAFAVSCDPGSPDGVSLLVEEVMGRFGRCDVLVNCAGLMLFRPFGELDLQTWRRVQAVNVEAASKGAIVGFTRAMAVGLGASGITVNAIAPGLVFTEATLATVSDASSSVCADVLSLLAAPATSLSVDAITLVPSAALPMLCEIYSRCPTVLLRPFGDHSFRGDQKPAD